MRKQILLVCSWGLLFCGWLSAFWLNAMQLHSTLYILVPALFLGVGMGLNRKFVTGKVMVVSLAFTALLAVSVYNQYHSQRRISLSDFKQRIHKGSSQKVLISGSGHKGQGPFSESQVLQAETDIDVSLYAELPGPARMLAFDERNTLYVSIPDLGVIYSLRDDDNDGFAENSQLFHYGLDRPHGLAWYAGRLYVATPSQVLALTDNNADMQADEVEVIYEGLPDDGGHLARGLVIDSSGVLLVSIGSRCNACEETDVLRATLQKIDLVSKQITQITPYATGLRNSVGLAVAPDNGQFWATDISRELQQTNIPPDEINQITEGGNYGWPYCFGQKLVDPTFNQTKLCRESSPSQLDLPVHSTPTGIAFGAQLKAPQEYKDSLYIALNGGSGSEPRLIRVPYRQGKVETFAKEFLSGWQQGDVPWGRPVAPHVGLDGSLYLSDDLANAIYRISWK
jgi:glucose/arabinose dehydrogenase